MMKYIFIVNPHAGEEDHAAIIRSQIENLPALLECSFVCSIMVIPFYIGLFCLNDSDLMFTYLIYQDYIKFWLGLGYNPLTPLCGRGPASELSFSQLFHGAGLLEYRQ